MLIFDNFDCILYAIIRFCSSGSARSVGFIGQSRCTDLVVNLIMIGGCFQLLLFLLLKSFKAFLSCAYSI